MAISNVHYIFYLEFVMQFDQERHNLWPHI
jgi:hypothetical protein